MIKKTALLLMTLILIVNLAACGVSEEPSKVSGEISEGTNNSLESEETFSESWETSSESAEETIESEEETSESKEEMSEIEKRIRSITYVKGKIKKVDTERVDIYTPDGSEDAWYFSHVPSIVKFKGKFYVTWHSGRRDEDAPGQRVMMAVSDNFTDWKVEVLVDTIMGEYSEKVCGSTILYADEETITLKYSASEYKTKEMLEAEGGGAVGAPGGDKTPDGTSVSNKFNFESRFLHSTDGINWTVQEAPSFHTGCQKMFKLKSGQLVSLGHSALAIFEDGKLDGEFRNYELELCEKDKAAANILSESCGYEHEDGTIYVFSRTRSMNMLCAASVDGGKTWTEMYETGFMDVNSRSEMGRLPDGRYYFLSNEGAGRGMLMLTTSEDGIVWDEHYLLGMEGYALMKEGSYKIGNYGYPFSYIDDEYMYVVYSAGKESIRGIKVKLADIGVE